MNVNQPAAYMVPASLQHDGGIEHNDLDRRVRFCRLDPRLEVLLDPGEEHCLEGLPLGWVGKHNGTDLAAIDFAPLIEHARAPPLDHLISDLGLEESGMAKIVAGDHGGAAPRQLRSHHTLATP